MSVRSQHEAGGLGDAFERPMSFDLEAASELIGDPKPSGVGLEVHIPSTAVLPELYRMPAISGLEAGEADLLPKLSTAKKPLERLIQPVGKGLYGGLRDVFAASTLESIGGVVLAKKLPGLVVMRLDQLEHLVVKVAAFRQRRKELTPLNTSRIKAVLEGLMHCPNGTFIRDSAQRPITESAKADGPLAVFL